MCTNRRIAICCNPTYGPTFGTQGWDIHITSDSNANNFSCSQFGYDYKHPDYPAGTEKAKSILAGSYQFKTLEIEVFVCTN